ncbi:MAG: murein L,D-transpeptidase YafK [Gammaproteobacteria bacterium]|jgi:murein L,D-transpeptidase YafK
MIVKLLALLLIGIAVSIAVMMSPVTAQLVPQARAVATAQTLQTASPIVAASSARNPAGIVLVSDSEVDAKRLGITASAMLPDEERSLLLAFEALASSRLDAAEHHLRPLLAKFPEFHLARLTLADVLMARSGRLVDFASGAAGKRVETLRQEALVRLANARNANLRVRQPDVLLQMSESQSRAVVVDLSASRMYLYHNVDGALRLERSFYVSIGKNGAAKRIEGDQRTPVGVYFVTGRIDGAALPDFFGPGALAVNYPNEWDLRARRTGYGIWIHGVPSDTFARAPRASDGCIALSNEHISLLLNLPQGKDTPVIIADGLNWLEASELKKRRGDFNAVLERWIRDWESADLGRYGAHYSRDFHSEDRERATWLNHKRRVNAAKQFIKVSLSDVSVFAYPGERDMVVVTFEQDYQSSNFSNRSRKRQYWRKEAGGVWRIVFEGPVKLRSEQLRGMPYSARARASLR